MGFLGEITERKKERIAGAKRARTLGELKTIIKDAAPARSFSAAVKGAPGELRLIAEIKRASPSRGIIRKDFDLRAIAAAYKGRADAVSVITEEDYFMGDPGYLKDAGEVTGLPVLRKDFVIDEYQLYEARALGADAVLLIEDILDSTQAAEYLHLARELGMGTLFEVHGMRGLEKALALDAPVIGINNRDLDTFEVSLETTLKLKAEVPAGRTVVSESGVNSHSDVQRLIQAGVDAVLIGTAFMKAPDIGAAVDEIMGRDG